MALGKALKSDRRSCFLRGHLSRLLCSPLTIPCTPVEQLANWLFSTPASKKILNRDKDTVTTSPMRPVCVLSGIRAGMTSGRVWAIIVELQESRVGGCFGSFFRVAWSFLTLQNRYQCPRDWHLWTSSPHFKGLLVAPHARYMHGMVFPGCLLLLAMDYHRPLVQAERLFDDVLHRMYFPLVKWEITPSVCRPSADIAFSGHLHNRLNLPVPTHPYRFRSRHLECWS